MLKQDHEPTPRARDGAMEAFVVTTLLALAEATEAAAPASNVRIWAYAGFIALVAVCLAIDLGIFHKEAHEVSFKEALGWSTVWVSMALLFAVFVYYAYNNHWLDLGKNTPFYPTQEQVAAATRAAHEEGNLDYKPPLIFVGEVEGSQAVKLYLAAYIVEESLSMDNMFVIALIFGAFGIPRKYQHRVLFWGILGAILMRGAMIFAGTALIERFQWILIIFGGFLVLTAVKMAMNEEHGDPNKNFIVRLTKRILPITDFLDGQRFVTHRTLPPEYKPDPATGKMVMQPPPPGTLGKRMFTPLFLALIMVEFTDLIFAVDSIPAVVAITPDPFIVFTSNIFAIMGLRSLYFCLAAMIAKFRYLKPALVLILGFVGVKLLLFSVPPYLWGGKQIKISIEISLAVVLGTLALAVLLSVLRPVKDGDQKAGAH